MIKNYSACLRILLPLLASLDSFWLWCRKLKTKGSKPASAAGAGIQYNQKIQTLAFGSVEWPVFPSTAHGFWRAQELTLFKRNSNYIRLPLLDLGGGDGIFGAAAGWSRERTNLDCDKASLELAKSIGETNVCFGTSIDMPFENASFQTCVSNSVFEHLPDLKRTIEEIARVLKTDGYLLFSMTLGKYTHHLEFSSGKSDARLWTAIYGHIQQPVRREVLELLMDNGFIVEKSFSYQPQWFTELHRFFVSPAVQFFERRLPEFPKKRLREILAPLVQQSLSSDFDKEKCACLFVVARKL